MPYNQLDEGREIDLTLSDHCYGRKKFFVDIFLKDISLGANRDRPRAIGVIFVYGQDQHLQLGCFFSNSEAASIPLSLGMEMSRIAM